MIGSIFRSAWSLLVLGVVGYFVFFVPLGERTLFQHMRRIAATDEAGELREEVGVAGQRLADDLRRELEQDAGPPPPGPEPR
jgi:hypothetical protein